MSPQVQQWLLFVISVTLCVAGVHLYLWQRMVKDTALPKVARRIAGTVLIICVLLFPLGRYLNRIGVYSLVFLPLFFWLGNAMVLAMYLMTADSLRFIWKRLRPKNLAVAVDQERRIFLNRSLAWGGIASSAVTQIYGYQQAYAINVKPVDVPIANLPTEFHGFRIAQITDLHVGPLIQRNFVEQVVAQINDLDVDLVAVTGDIVDGSVEELKFHVAPLKDLRSVHGTFFVTGNHEFYSGADSWCAHFEALGFRVLRNEAFLLERSSSALHIAGIEDWSSGYFGEGPDLEKTFAQCNAKWPLVLLSHQPKSFDLARTKGVALQISGHTHGGQIWPIGLLLPLVYSRYNRGLYKVDQSHIYVSCGTGFWGPALRIAAPSEITVIRLIPG